MQRSYIITILFLILALIFTFQNTASISMKFLFWNFTGSLALNTVIIFFVGLTGGWFMGWSNVWNKNKEIRTLKKQVAELSKPVPPPAK
ncbi:MAG TPA: LapA family protein [Chitinophagales bacterium]|nr:LapA family protein [Chitinophagales bacterium]